jgi:hypothetical protein
MRYMFSPNINYFVNLPSDNIESDDEFDSCTIPYLNNFIINESLSHARSLPHFDSFIKILKDMINELEKIISNYHIKMDELERLKIILSKYRG